MRLGLHLIFKEIIMKIRLLSCVGSFVFAMGAIAQTPTPALLTRNLLQWRR
jgi:hypothetical protein